MSKFQAIFIGVIIVLIFVAFLILSGALPGLPGRGQSNVTLTLWGTLPVGQVSGALGILNKNLPNITVRYAVKDNESYENDLVDALASGNSPDLFFFTQDLVLEHRNKVFLTPLTSFGERTFKDSFIDEGEMFLLKDGIVAFPILIDPIVLYWNKDYFAKAGLASPPVFWEEFLNQVTNLTVKDRSGNILESGAALGEFENIENVKDIFSLLVLQGGTEIVEKNSWVTKFGYKGTVVSNPAVSALNFFTSFSNPSKVSYSWNRALPNSRDLFIAGKLAMYFGYAGELSAIRDANPHLNFDVAIVPQVKDSPLQITFGRVYGLAMPKISVNTSYAFTAASDWATNDEVIERLVKDTRLAPAKRSVLSKGNMDPALSVFYKSAIRSRAWFEPDSNVVSGIFKEMIYSVTTGKKNFSLAVGDAQSLLMAEVNKLKD